MPSKESLHELLLQANSVGKLPSVTGYHRIDGPGSSLSLPDFQRTFWTLAPIPANLTEDPSWGWSQGLPRTIGWTINTGTKVTAYPFTAGRLAIESQDYQQYSHIEAKVGEIPLLKRNWLLKIMETFGLSGVLFRFENIDKRTRSGGLGGSATVSTTSAILANYLTGCPMSSQQVVAIASTWENDLGVSLTGTQEQWNVIWGGVADYVWFPWGHMKGGMGFGDSLVRNLLSKELYGELESRSLLVFSGHERASKNVNRVWLSRLKTKSGYRLHKKKLDLAYTYAEAIRLQDWELVSYTIKAYCDIRTQLCPEYLYGAEQVIEIAAKYNAAIFPLGAGGGGFILIWSPYSETTLQIKSEIRSRLGNERILEFKILEKGHEMTNLIRTHSPTC